MVQKILLMRGMYMKSSRYEVQNESIITGDEIKLILDRYRIGKKPLAKLLGWGETTIIRYMEGDIPTSEYSSKLKTILEDPQYYYDLLISRQECLTNVAFRKSKKAALSKIMSSKISSVAYYIVNRANGEISASYIQYLLYYIQAFSLAFNDKEMFQEECNVSNEVIPYTKLYEGMKRCGIHTLELVEEYLTEQEVELINSVQDGFSWYGSRALQTLISYEKSMLKISRDKFNNRIITKDALNAYFKGILEKYDITGIKEIGKYPDQKMLELKEIC
jgi:hypothetical protein